MPNQYVPQSVIEQQKFMADALRGEIGQHRGTPFGALGDLQRRKKLKKREEELLEALQRNANISMADQQMINQQRQTGKVPSNPMYEALGKAMGQGKPATLNGRPMANPPPAQPPGMAAGLQDVPYQMQTPGGQLAQYQVGQDQLEHQRELERLEISGGNAFRAFQGGVFVDDNNEILAIGQPNNTGRGMSITKPHTGEILSEAPPGTTYVTNAAFNAQRPGVIDTMGSAENEVKQEQQVYTADLENLNESAAEIERSLADIDDLNQVLQFNSFAEQGTAGPMINWAKGLFASAGWEIDSLADTAMLDRATNNMLANYMKQLGARGLTDADMKVLQNTLPNIGQSEEARRRVAEIMIRSRSDAIRLYQERLRNFQEKYKDRVPMQSPRYQEYIDQVQGGTTTPRQATPPPARSGAQPTRLVFDIDGNQVSQ